MIIFWRRVTVCVRQRNTCSQTVLLARPTLLVIHCLPGRIYTCLRWAQQSLPVVFCLLERIHTRLRSARCALAQPLTSLHLMCRKSLFCSRSRVNMSSTAATGSPPVSGSLWAISIFSSMEAKGASSSTRALADWACSGCRAISQRHCMAACQIGVGVSNRGTATGVGLSIEGWMYQSAPLPGCMSQGLG